MERATRRVNSAYYDEVYDAFWAQKNFVQEDIKKTMDARPGNSSSKVQKKTNFRDITENDSSTKNFC